MSDWIGPNVYRIAGYADRKSAVTVKDGSKSENAEVVTKYAPQRTWAAD